jgi:CheY-like chemotaxis protein
MEEILLALAFPLREGAQERTRLRIACETTHVAEQADDGGPLSPGAYARIVMQDNGVGVDADKRRMMFEAVLMKETPAKVTEQTAAAGIARAYAIVREWGGDITFESEPSRGSAFQLYLPVATTVAPPSRSPRAAGRSAATPRETILVVDDEPGIRGLVVKILRRERYQVLEAGSAAEAVTVAVNHGAPIQMLVTDVMMPGRSGRELADQFRETMPNLKVLYISGFTGDEFARTGEFPRGSRFLQKPFTLDALVRMVRELLDS